jgi:predicted regulator of Ras-like GTPase activity (Roadblock/LC7/MglB family)
MPLNGHLVLTKSHADRIDRALLELLKKAEARCALLVQQNGRLLAQRGRTEGLNVEGLAALVAGCFATTREMARLLGEPEFSVLFNQGQSEHIHNLLVDDETILTVLFDQRTTIGMVRLYSKEYGKEITAVLKAAQTGTGAGESAEAMRDADAEGLDSDTQSRLDHVFSA